MAAAAYNKSYKTGFFSLSLKEVEQREVLHLGRLVFPVMFRSYLHSSMLFVLKMLDKAKGTF